MMIHPSIRAELTRSQMERLHRDAERHHRAKRRGTSPRRPDPGHEPNEH